MISYAMYHSEKICANPKCGKPTNRHQSAQFCWECAKENNAISAKKSCAKQKLKKETALNVTK